MDRYNHAKIYKIVCNKTGLCYIGSTCEPTLARRLAKHRANYKEYLKGRQRHITAFQVLENNDYSIVLLENVECKSKDELFARERFHIENTECVNKVKPIVSDIERKERIAEYKKDYQHVNREQIAEYKKKLYETNKEQILEQQKVYREANRDKINEKQKEKYICECGIQYTYTHKLRHQKSLKHINYCNEINPQSS